jgi:uncharacterized membrane protein
MRPEAETEEAPMSVTCAGERLAELRRRALERYALRCFWSAPKNISDEGISRRLREDGDLAACTLADEIDDAIREATHASR